MRIFLVAILLFPFVLFGQSRMEQIIDEEYVKGRFNGTLYYVEAEQVVQINRGFANFQFEVEINDKTRFPLASVTKLFTAIAILQLQEKGLVHLEDSLGQFIPDIAENCRDISIRNLLLHYSGLENEPIQAVISRYSIDDYIRNFVKRNISSNPKFNYNNVDYVLLSKVVERATGQTFAQSITDLILKPTKMDDTGFVDEQAIIKDLAYGYHNYSFGEGDKGDPLFNDSRYISNYRGAGGMYATAADLYKFLQAIKNNQLISEETKQQFLLSRQSEDYIDWLSGTPTVGLYVDAEKAVFRRSGSIDGFNSQIIISRNFDKLLIILCNTDTADLDSLADRLYFEK